MNTTFSLPNVDGRNLGLADFPDAKAVILIFTCNHCPYAIAYEGRIQALHDEFAPQGIPVLAISSNDATRYPQDSFEQMQARARDKGFGYPYLYDERQEIARAYDAERTPHAFILLRQGADWSLVYKGAIDDNYERPEAVHDQYVAGTARRILATGGAPYRETPAIGCGIKWKA
ncbi:MAG: thioredoxin family protein [Bacteroidetes bacterium]|nr:MAG: thioredoxin family protein [Bacteroidota bacterium]